MPEAYMGLGEIYHFGYGVEQNYSKAFEWYYKAAEGNYIPAYKMVSYMYDEGKGCVKMRLKRLSGLKICR